MTEKEIAEIESWLNDPLGHAQHERASFYEHGCKSLIQSLRAERAALERAATFMRDKVGDYYEYNGPCPNTHEDLCREMPWCDWIDRDDIDDDLWVALEEKHGKQFMEDLDEGYCTVYNGKDCWLKYFREVK